MTTVLLGNVKVREVVDVDDVGNRLFRHYEGHSITTVTIPDDWTASEKMRQVTHDDGFWPAMSGAHPAWVESDDESLANALAYFYGCPVGRPADWDSDSVPTPAGIGPASGPAPAADVPAVAAPASPSTDAPAPAADVAPADSAPAIAPVAAPAAPAPATDGQTGVGPAAADAPPAS